MLSSTLSHTHPLLANEESNLLDVLGVFVSIGRSDAVETHTAPVCSLTPLHMSFWFSL